MHGDSDDDGEQDEGRREHVQFVLARDQWPDLQIEVVGMIRIDKLPVAEKSNAADGADCGYVLACPQVVVDGDPVDQRIAARHLVILLVASFLPISPGQELFWWGRMDGGSTENYR